MQILNNIWEQVAPVVVPILVAGLTLWLRKIFAAGDAFLDGVVAKHVLKQQLAARDTNTPVDVRRENVIASAKEAVKSEIAISPIKKAITMFPLGEPSTAKIEKVIEAKLVPVKEAMREAEAERALSNPPPPPLPRPSGEFSGIDFGEFDPNLDPPRDSER